MGRAASAGIVGRMAGFIGGVGDRALAPLIGRRLALPRELVDRYPELGDAVWRTGGLPPRIGGWCLGQRTVAGITLGRTIWLAPGVRTGPWLLLHELGHVRQFAHDPRFPLRYAWESLRRGYHHNRFEAEADAFAARVLGDRPSIGGAFELPRSVSSSEDP